MIKRLIISLILLSIGLTSYSQSFFYSYTDPCNGNVKSINIPSGQNMVTINYFNQYRTFTQADFGNGVFDNWITNTYTQYKNTSPCTGVGVSTVVSQTQSIANTLTGIINTVSNLSFPSPNSPDAQEPAETPEIDLGDDVDGGTTPDATTSTGNSGSTGSGTDGSGSTGGSGGTGGTGGTGGSGGSGGGNGSDPGSTDGESSGGGGSNVVGGTAGSIKSSSGGGSGNSKSSGANNQKQNALKPTVVGSSDLVAFNSAGDNSKGGKVSGGYTATRWDGLKTHGFLCDYSTQMKGPNITTFVGWIKPKVTTLLSTTGSIGFEGKGSLYGSLAFGQVRNFKKVKVVYMLSGSYGHVYEQRLIGTSVIAGGMYDFKIGKAIGVKLTSLLVYSPYMQYYNDLLLKSPLVVLPSIGTNIGLTKTFKININFGGAYQVNSGALNYSLIVGSRIAL
jgi:hypothetical protein